VLQTSLNVFVELTNSADGRSNQSRYTFVADGRSNQSRYTFVADGRSNQSRYTFVADTGNLSAQDASGFVNVHSIDVLDIFQWSLCLPPAQCYNTFRSVLSVSE